ncbi:MucR family transcriptional regulator [Sulfitobacter sp. JB4-11]|uniref:MucR family transcriptional regulator n=1 Tax=Sulfitobacter rhodophyticola TaxID=3238304 RepID=UPI003D816778
MRSIAQPAMSDAMIRIVSAYASRESATVKDILDLIRSLDGHVDQDTGSPTLIDIAAGAQSAKPLTIIPAVPIEDSVTDETVVCLCCGRSFTMLKRHLKAEHGLTEEQYRLNFGLPEDHPLVAPNYSVRKAEYAKRIGLGRYSRADGVTETDSSSA